MAARTYLSLPSSLLSNVFWRMSSSIRPLVAWISAGFGGSVDTGGVTPRSLYGYDWAMAKGEREADGREGVGREGRVELGEGQSSPDPLVRPWPLSTSPYPRPPHPKSRRSAYLSPTQSSSLLEPRADVLCHAFNLKGLVFFTGPAAGARVADHLA